IASNGVELRICRPGSAGRQKLRSVLELTLAHFIRRVDEVKLVLDMRALEHLPKPGPLRPRVARKVENDRNTLRQDGANVGRDRMPYARRACHQTGYVGDLAGEEALEELVLNEEDGVAALGKIFRERRLPRCHLAAQEHQLRRVGHDSATRERRSI